MPSISELTTSVKSIVLHQKWRTTTFFISNKEVGFSNDVAFTPLLSAYYLSQCTANDQVAMIANQLINLLPSKDKNLQWNYYFCNQKYPNDLDNTIIASSVLLKTKQRTKSEIISAIVKNLIAVEEMPGGPYRTWFVEKNDPDWGQDIDLIVNYRVHNFLQQIDIRLPNLEQWLHSNAKSRNLSLYYSGFESKVIQAAITDSWEWQKLIPSNQYEAALLLIIALNQHKHTYLTELYDYYRLLIEMPIEKIGAIPAFVDKIKDDTTQWAGSLLLSHSICLAAITLFQQQLTQQNHTKSKHAIEKGISDQINNLLSRTPSTYINEVKAKALELNHLSHSPALHYITESLFLNIPQTNNNQLREKIIAAAIIGWIAYTFHDQVIDSEIVSKRNFYIITSRILTLLVQNCFLDCCDAIFSKDKLIILDWIKTTFLEMEHTYYVDVSANLIHSSSLDWDKYLYQRSAGLVIAPVMLCKLNGIKLSIEELLHVYKPLIIARQILDDIHDLNDDLQHNRLTFVTSQIYCKDTNVKPALTHTQTAAIHAYSLIKINEYLQKAQKQVAKLPSNYHEVFIPEIKRLENIIDQQLTTHAVVQALLPENQDDKKRQPTDATIPSPAPNTTSNRPTATGCSSRVESQSTG